MNANIKVRVDYELELFLTNLRAELITDFPDSSITLIQRIIDDTVEESAEWSWDE